MSTPFTITGENWWQIDKLEELRLAFAERVQVVTQEIPVYAWESTDERYDLFAVEGDMTSDDKLKNNAPTQGFNAQSVAFFGDMQEYISHASYFDGIPLFMHYAKKWEDVEGDYDSPFRYYSGEVITNLQFGGEYNSYTQNYSFAWADFCEYAGSPLWGPETVDPDWGFTYNPAGWRFATTVDEDGHPVIQQETNRFAQEGDIIGVWLIEDLICAFNAMTIKLCGYKHWYDPPS